MSRIFGLDAQLIHDTLWTAAAIFILFFGLSYLLFNPARKMLEERKKKIKDTLDDANDRLKKAKKDEEEYKKCLADVKKESAKILDETKKRADETSLAIVAEAKEEAAALRLRAEKEIALEREAARDSVKGELVQLSALMAEKVIAKNMTEEISDAFIEETLAELEDKTWD